MVRRLGSATLASVWFLCMGTGCPVPELAESASPGGEWPDLAYPNNGPQDGWHDAALIIATDESLLGGRVGADAVASAWWRYFVDVRGLRPGRVELLRNTEIGYDTIHRAVERLKAHAGSGSVLWLVFIGSANSPSDGHDGALLVAGEPIAFEPIRAAISRGDHESAVAIIDACMSPDMSIPPGLRPGLPALPLPSTPLSPTSEAPERPQLDPGPVASDDRRAPTNSLSAGAQQSMMQARADYSRVAGTPRNTFVLTAGLGRGCADTLIDGRSWPALSYAALGGIQGWADRNGDQRVSAVELGAYAQAMVEGELRAQGVNLTLADLTHVRLDAPVVEWSTYLVTSEALALASESIELSIEDMVDIPAGSFLRGCPRSQRRRCEKDERPARTLTLDGYAIDRLEVSWADYRTCVEFGMCKPPALDRCWVWTKNGFELGAELSELDLRDDHPAVCLDWREAQTFCEALGKRLPTEAQWERAARGTDGRIYPWGNSKPKCINAVFDGCGVHSFGVGGRPAGASPEGALDMSGNVSEWVRDWWHETSYLYAASHNPEGPDKGEVRVVRGGSFYDPAEYLRSTYRYGIAPEARLSTVGFRCAR